MSAENDNQPAPAIPAPNQEDTDRTTSEQTFEGVRTPSPGMATQPRIKNN